MNRQTSLLLCLVLAVPCAGIANTNPGEWSRFRGPNGSGLSLAKNLPGSLNPDEDMLWRIPLAGGHSSPILAADALFLTTADDDGLHTLCIDPESGEVRWTQTAPRTREEALDNRNNAAAPSPVADDELVVSFFSDYGLLAYNHEGEELWRHPLAAFDNIYGMGASPIMADGLVLLACDQATGSYLVALDKQTGKQRWRSERPWAKSGHCTPILNSAVDGTNELILPGSFYLDGYRIKDGNRNWWAKGLCFEMKSVPVIWDGLILINGYGSPMNQPGNQVTISSFEEALANNDKDEDGLISKAEMPASRAANWFDFVDLSADGSLDAADWKYLRDALASQNGMLAFRPGGEGELSAESLTWSYRRAVPQLPSPLIYENVLYMLNDNGGLLTTLSPKTGEVIERGRLEDGVDSYYASPVAGDGKIYIVSEHGTALVLPAGGSLKPLYVHNFEERVYATPALAEGRLYLRTEVALYSFGSK
ncbi:MAG: outer membrane protein assembly factor BamB [Candidatus Paceibacteria bacterium]|jgi:outer membrane protein assembly factor BamB